MGKKRKSVATSLDEVDRTLHSTFCGAANSLSQLYTQSMNQQKLTFQAGERHGLEKLYQWILRQEEGGSRVNTVDILTHLQTKLDYCGDEPLMSPRASPQHQHSPMTMQLTNSELLVSSVSSGALNTGQGFHTEQCDQQSKNYVFSNALSSPVCQSLQNHHNTQGGDYDIVLTSANGTRNNEPDFMQHQKGDSNYYNSNNSSMEMHAYSPGHKSTY
ncbi:uncharacterized protein LOC130758296 [Actinidia eriantha]|uniref:uncharacterized protein LOC130758296 n=1 Tax=Actinidia eriantha TaxID=165200 RepID=UPI00258EAB70|nr:uncharacterized protein LOC130758296 [Actinidia eriantha]